MAALAHLVFTHVQGRFPYGTPGIDNSRSGKRVGRLKFYDTGSIRTFLFHINNTQELAQSDPCQPRLSEGV